MTIGGIFAPSRRRAIESLFAGRAPASYRKKLPFKQDFYLLDGKIVQWKGEIQSVLSPLCFGAKGAQFELGSYPLFSEKEALEALRSAVKAYDKGRGIWPTMSVKERIKSMEAFVVDYESKREEIVNLLMWEIGKSLNDSEREFDRTAEYINDTINAMKDLDHHSSRLTVKGGVVGQVKRAPLGVVLCMGPSNYPLNETFATLIPALLMGNVVIFKPPRVGVLLHAPLLELFARHFPAGVVNPVYGEGQKVISPLMCSGQIDVLAFIGSSKVASLIKKQHPKPHRLRCVLGLEAKNAAIVLEDADLELAVEECLKGSLTFNGQRCTALKSIYLQEKIADDFLTLFKRKLEGKRFGLPWDEGVFLTPLMEIGQVNRMKELLDDALAHGACVANDNGGLINQTFFYPALVSGVDAKMRLFHEEQFGPLVPVSVFKKAEEPLAWIINSDYGQQVSLFGRNPRSLAKLIDPLANQVCRINLNCQCQRGPDIFPFTGRKDSAEGTLSVSDALRVFSIRSMVATADTPENEELVTAIIHGRHSSFLSTDFIL